MEQNLDSFYLNLTKNIKPNKIENCIKETSEETTLNDLMKDLNKIPRSEFKKSNAPKYKNGYRQGVEIGVLSMDDAKNMAGVISK